MSGRYKTGEAVIPHFAADVGVLLQHLKKWSESIPCILYLQTR